MARYTVELREIVKSGLKIFNFEYEFYNENKKAEFEQRFIDHFYFREIGFETVGRFQHYLKVTCNEKLPYYNMLLETSLFEYDIKNNYNLTETFTKSRNTTKDINGNMEQSGNSNSSSNASGQASTERDMTNTGNKQNTLSSVSEHEQSTDTTGDITENETNAINKTSENTINNTSVESDTPNGLLAMEDIKNNVYASKVKIDDNLNSNVDEQTGTVEKSNTSKENVKGNSTDTVNATSTDATTDVTSDKISETNSNSINANGSVSNKTNTLQNELGNETETYTLERVGDIGVDTTPDKLLKHIEVQKIFTTIYIKFFEECEDLFMQVF